MNKHNEYTNVRGSKANSFATLVGLRFHKDLPNSWPYFEMGIGYGRIALPAVTAATAFSPTVLYDYRASGVNVLLETGAELRRQSRVGAVVSFGIDFFGGPDAVRQRIATARIGAVYH